MRHHPNTPTSASSLRQRDPLRWDIITTEANIKQLKHYESAGSITPAQQSRLNFLESKLAHLVRRQHTNQSHQNHITPDTTETDNTPHYNAEAPF